MCTNIPSQRLTAFGQVRMCELVPAACPGVFEKRYACAALGFGSFNSFASDRC